jgi:signal peptidase I
VRPPPRFGRQHRGAPAQRSGHGSFLAELPVLVLVAFVLALLLKTFLIQAFYIPSESMVPTLEVGDRVLVNKVVYELRAPRRGEVVVFSDNEGAGGASSEEQPNVAARFARSLASGLGLTPAGERDFIKRIIGLPGDTVEMRDGEVYVNGQALPEAPASEGGYLSSRDLNAYGPYEVPAGHYFMMGDNRPNSSDSRFGLGAIPEEAVIGRAFVIIWPVSRLDTLPGASYSLVSVRQTPA